MEALGWEYLEEKLTIGLTDDLRAAIDPAPFGRAPRRRTGGASPAGGICSPRMIHGSTNAPRQSRRTASPPSGAAGTEQAGVQEQEQGPGAPQGEV